MPLTLISDRCIGDPRTISTRWIQLSFCRCCPRTNTFRVFMQSTCTYSLAAAAPFTTSDKYVACPIVQIRIEFNLLSIDRCSEWCVYHGQYVWQGLLRASTTGLPIRSCTIFHNLLSEGSDWYVRAPRAYVWNILRRIGLASSMTTT